MRPVLNLIASVMLGAVSVLSVNSPGRVGALLDQLVPAPAPVVATPRSRPPAPSTVRTALQGEATGLVLIHPYARGKIPAVLIHGLGATPQSWNRMIDDLEASPTIRNHYQFWAFGYASGQPILYSASLLRQALREAREHYDPAKTDPAFDHMVLIGYSMGGILAKVMAEDSRSVLWRQISDQPAEKLAGPADARAALLQSFFFKAVPEVHRIIFVATPHRGSRADQGALHWLFAQLNQPLDTLRKFHSALVASNQPEFFREPFRQGVSGSVDQLAWEHPRLMALFDLGLNPDVKLHSIIADVNDPPSAGGTDGVVSYASSHLDGATSERIVHGGHLCLANPQVISECDRILKEHLGSSDDRSHLTATRPGDQRNQPFSEPETDPVPQAHADGSRSAAQARNRAG
jgi:pimeloyl-ACP methyl ester carboxylesterase